TDVVGRGALALELDLPCWRARERTGERNRPLGAGARDAGDLQRHSILAQHRIGKALDVGSFHGGAETQAARRRWQRLRSGQKTSGFDTDSIEPSLKTVACEYTRGEFV